MAIFRIFIPKVRYLLILKAILISSIFVIINLFSLASAGAVNNCILITSITIDSTNKYIDKKVKNITNKSLGQCVNITDIKNILREITNLYVDMGHITTRVYLPEQDLSSGDLQIKVVEGYIESIDVEDGHRLIPAFIPLKANKLLSLRDIEQTYDHYSKSSSNDVNIVIKPGEKQGASKILIVNKPKRKWKLKTGIDNSGSKQQGEILSYTNLSVDNFLGHNETYLFNVKSSVDEPDKKYTRSKSFYFSMPFEYCDLSYQYNLSNNKKYKNSGNNTIYKVDLSRVLHRDGKSKTHISAGYGHDIYSSYLDASKIQISSYKIHKADFGLSYQTRLSASVFTTGFNVTSGINKGFFSKFGEASIPSEKFSKININASWFKPTPVVIANRNIQFRSSFSAQYSPDMLASSEKFSLGGANSVRGFKEFRENSDNALQLRNELVAFLPQQDSKLYQKFFGDFSTFIAFDIGYFSNYEEKTERIGALSGVATGIRNSDGIFDIDIVLARPIQTTYNYKHKNILHFSFGVNI